MRRFALSPRCAAVSVVLRRASPRGVVRRFTISCVPDDDRLLTPLEAAQAIGVSRSTLAKWAREGQLTPTVVLPNGDRRWSLPDLRRQLDEWTKRAREQEREGE